VSLPVLMPMTLNSTLFHIIPTGLHFFASQNIFTNVMFLFLFFSDVVTTLMECFTNYYTQLVLTEELQLEVTTLQ